MTCYQLPARRCHIELHPSGGGLARWFAHQAHHALSRQRSTLLPPLRRSTPGQSSRTVYTPNALRLRRGSSLDHDQCRWPNEPIHLPRLRGFGGYVPQTIRTVPWEPNPPTEHSRPAAPDKVLRSTPATSPPPPRVGSECVAGTAADCRQCSYHRWRGIGLRRRLGVDRSSQPINPLSHHRCVLENRRDFTVPTAERIVGKGSWGVFGSPAADFRPCFTAHSGGSIPSSPSPASRR